MKQLNNKQKKIFNYYMIVIGILGQLVFFAQAYKIFTSRSAGDVSRLGFSLGLVSVTSWLIYGIIFKSFPLIIANTIAVVGCIAVLFGIYLYG